MQPRLSFLTLGVADLARARAFYAEVLGWPLSAKSQEGVAFFQLNGFVLALFPAAGLARDAGLAPEQLASGFKPIALAHNVAERDQVDALLAKLASEAPAGSTAAGKADQSR